MNNEFRTLVFEMKNTRSNLINQERTREASAMFFEEQSRKANTLFQQLGYMSTKEDNVFGKRAKELDAKKDTIQQTTVIDEVLDEVLNGKQYQIATTTHLVDLDKIMRNKELHNYHYDAAIAIIVLVDYIIDKKLNLDLVSSCLSSASNKALQVLRERREEKNVAIVKSQCDSIKNRLKMAQQLEIMHTYINKEKYMGAFPPGYYVAKDGIKYSIQLYLRDVVARCKTSMSEEACIDLLNKESQKWFEQNKEKCDNAKRDWYRKENQRQYEKLVTERIVNITSIPADAEKKYTNLKQYQERVKSAYLKRELYDDMIAQTANEQTSRISEKAQVLFEKADEMLKKEIAEEVAIIQKREKEEEKERKKETIQNIKLKYNSIIVIGVIVIVVVVGGLLKGGLAKLIPAAAPSRQDMSEEVWWEYLEKTLGEDIAENSPTATPAEDFEYEVVTFPSLNILEGKTSCTYSYTGVAIKKYIGTDAKVEIPAVIDGYNVCEIARGAFEDNIYLEEIIIPDTVNTIKEAAFARCTQLENVVYSANLAIIEKNAFSGCSKLTSFSTEGGVLAMKHIGEGAFENCSALQSVKMNVSCDADLDFVIESKAFSGCVSLQEVSISGLALEHLDIREYAFSGCSELKNVDFWDKITTLRYEAFINCTSLESASLAGLTDQAVPRGCFNGCTGLKSFDITANLKGVDSGAFSGCTSLQTVTFEQLSTGEQGAGYAIADYAFAETAISQIEISGNYDYIGEKAFAGCTNMSKVIWHGNGKNTLSQNMADRVFDGCSSLTEVYLPRTISGISDNWDFSIMPNVTIYAYEGSFAHEYALKKGVKWQNYTE